jgi:Uncharacterised nucleotidyltransferase
VYCALSGVSVDQTIGRLFRAICARDLAEIESHSTNPIWTNPDVIRDTVDAAVYHAIVPLAAEILLEKRFPHLLRSKMMKVYRAQATHVLRLELLLRNVAGSFGSTGVPFAAFKGATLAHGYYANAVQRAYVDVDILVRAENLGQADATLRDMGCMPTEPNWQVALSQGYGEVLYQAPNGAALDLHWHPIREPAIRRVFTQDPGDLIDRSRGVFVGEMSVPALDAEDMIIVVATHACYDGAYRLGWLIDVARIEQSGQVRWDVLNDRCRETGLGLPVQVLLDRARRTLGYSQDIPPLGRGSWRTLTGMLTALRPVEQTFGRVGRGGVVFRATRRTSTSSVVALGHLAIAEVAKPVFTDPQHRWRRDRDLRDRPDADY